MKTIAFECETITPLIIAGANVNSPELRAPSIKGVLRFWWRAMNYSNSSNNSFKGLFQRESEIFGSTKKGGGRSKVTLVVRSNSELKVGNNIKTDYGLMWESGPDRTLSGEDTGIAYLLYSVIVLGDGRKYFKDGQKFSVELKSHDPDALKQACAAFWALAHFGGLGARSRRGGGNISITGISGDLGILKDGSDDLDFIIKGGDAEDVKKWLVKNYSRAMLIVNGDNSGAQEVTKYSSITKLRFILSSDSFNDWKGAMNSIGDMFSEYRTNNRSDPLGTAAFGLPRKHVKTNKKDYTRRASPLLIKLVKVGDRYHWLVLWLSGEFLPDGVKLRDDINKSSSPNYDKIKEFWDKVKFVGEFHE